MDFRSATWDFPMAMAGMGKTCWSHGHPAPDGSGDREPPRLELGETAKKGYRWVQTIKKIGWFKNLKLCVYIYIYIYISFLPFFLSSFLPLSFFIYAHAHIYIYTHIFTYTYLSLSLSLSLSLHIYIYIDYRSTILSTAKKGPQMDRSNTKPLWGY